MTASNLENNLKREQQMICIFVKTMIRRQTAATRHDNSCSGHCRGRETSTCTQERDILLQTHHGPTLPIGSSSTGRQRPCCTYVQDSSLSTPHRKTRNASSPTTTTDSRWPVTACPPPNTTAAAALATISRYLPPYVSTAPAAVLAPASSPAILTMTSLRAALAPATVRRVDAATAAIADPVGEDEEGGQLGAEPRPRPPPPEPEPPVGDAAEP